MNIMFRVLAISILWAVSFISQCASSTKRNQTSDLATLAIFNFKNLTQNKSFDYLSGSLKDAIESSLAKRFKFLSVKPAQIASSETEYLKPPIKKSDYNVLKLEEIANATSADVVLIGSFVYTAKKKKAGAEKIEMDVIIFLRDNRQIIGRDSIETKVDSKIFNVIGDIAAKAVRLIEAYAKEQSKKEGEQMKSTDGRLSLTKQSLGITPYIPPVF